MIRLWVGVLRRVFGFWDSWECHHFGVGFTEAGSAEIALEQVVGDFPANAAPYGGGVWGGRFIWGRSPPVI